ncbi:MAG TPA: hypothetical protein VGB64_01165 [Actinomycetota bacterium]
MKIKGRCTVCARDIPADLVVAGETAGRCPFCGTPMDADYSGNFLSALSNVQRAGSMLEAALDQLSSLGPTFDLDENSLLDPLRAAIVQRSKIIDARKSA